MFLSKGRFGIRLVPFGKIPGELTDHLMDALQDVFRKNVFKSRPQKPPLEAFDLNRSQYKTKELLEYLSSMRAYKEKILGVINEDIYKPGFPFLFGEASPVREIAIISVWRFMQNMKYFDCDPEILKMRAKKEAIQELGHTYGLRHCTDPTCIMSYSYTISELDRKSDQFCARCKAWF